MGWGLLWGVGKAAEGQRGRKHRKSRVETEDGSPPAPPTNLRFRAFPCPSWACWVDRDGPESGPGARMNSVASRHGVCEANAGKVFL